MKLSIRNVVFINMSLLICVAAYVLLYLLAIKTGCGYFVSEYRDIIVYLLWGGVIFVICKFKFKEFSLFGACKANAVKNVGYGLCLIFLYLSVTFAIDLIFNRSLMQITSKVELDYFHKPLAVFIFHACVSLVISPIVEETIFRGFFYPPFRDKFGVMWGIVLSSVIFTLWHLGGGLKGMFNIFVFGSILAYVFEKSKSLIPSIVAHGALNANYLIIIIYFVLNKNSLIKITYSEFCSIMLIFYLGMATIIFLRFRKEERAGVRAGVKS